MTFPSAHLLSVVVLGGLQQLWHQTAPAILQQLPLQGHLGVLTQPLLMGWILNWVQTCLGDQLLMEQRRPLTDLSLTFSTLNREQL